MPAQPHLPIALRFHQEFSVKEQEKMMREREVFSVFYFLPFLFLFGATTVSFFAILKSQVFYLII